MADTQIDIRLDGPAVTDGAIELRRLIQLGEQFQKAVDRMAYALEKQQGSRRKLHEVRDDTKLKFVGHRKGSFTAQLSIVRPPVLFADFYDLASDAVEKLVQGIGQLKAGKNGHLPSGYDQGVLVVLKELGNLLNHGIDTIEFHVSSQQHEYTATYDQVFKTQLTEYIGEPEEKIAGVEGQLLMANFGRDKYQCHLYQTENKYIRCTFDEDISDQIDDAMRHVVYAIGVALIDPATDEIASLHIKELHFLDREAPAGNLAEALHAYIAANDTVASFQRGWQQVITGQTKSIADLWDDIDAE